MQMPGATSVVGNVGLPVPVPVPVPVLVASTVMRGSRASPCGRKGELDIPSVLNMG